MADGDRLELPAEIDAAATRSCVAADTASILVASTSTSWASFCADCSPANRSCLHVPPRGQSRVPAVARPSWIGRWATIRPTVRGLRSTDRCAGRSNPSGRLAEIGRSVGTKRRLAAASSVGVDDTPAHGQTIGRPAGRPIDLPFRVGWGIFRFVESDRQRRDGRCVSGLRRVAGPPCGHQGAAGRAGPRRAISSAVSRPRRPRPPGWRIPTSCRSTSSAKTPAITSSPCSSSRANRSPSGSRRQAGLPPDEALEIDLAVPGRLGGGPRQRADPSRHQAGQHPDRARDGPGHAGRLRAGPPDGRKASA